jgi:hypothetical protein
MRTIETRVIVAPDGQLLLELPTMPDISPGEYRVVMVIEEKSVGKKKRPPLNFPVDDWGAWPADFSTNREDLYDDEHRAGLR